VNKLDKITTRIKSFLTLFVQYELLMLVVKVSDKLQYNVGKLQKWAEGADSIPKVVITVEKRED